MTLRELEGEIDRLAELAEEKGTLPGKAVVALLREEQLLDETMLDDEVIPPPRRPMDAADLDDEDPDAPDYGADEPDGGDEG